MGENMEIQFTPGAVRDAAYTGALENGGGKRIAASDSAAGVSTGDTVTVSQEAKLMTEATRTAQNSPDVRADKVEALRIQVNNGTYKPDSRLIAANMIREEPGLFQF